MSRAIPFAIFLAIFSAGTGFACTCLPPTVKEARHRADAIFLGTITTVTFVEPPNPGSRVIVKFEVSRVWKGPVTKQFEMRSIVEAGFCEGFFREDLVVGKQLLVFANRVVDGVHVSYSTNICTLTGPPERYNKTLQQLGQGRPPDD